MASDSERTDDGPWDELEKGFFAAAPPDVAEPPAEPMRFDDLDPIAPGPPLSRRAAVERRVAAWRASAAASASVAWQKLAPARAAAAVISRRSVRRVAAGARAAGRVGLAQIPRLLAFFRSSSRETRLLAAGVAALVAVTGVSAGVVASRGGGGGRSLPTLARQPIASGRAVASEIASPPVAMTAPAEDPRPASVSIATSVTTPGPRKRKHAKAPARQPVRANANVLSKSSHDPGARPASGR